MKTHEHLARLYYRLFNERRLDEAAQLVHPHASFRYVATRQHLIGRAGYRALAAMWLTAFEDGQLDVISLHVVDDHIVKVELLGRGTQNGDLVLGDALTIPATGVAGELLFRETLDIRDGLIVNVQLDFDLEQLKGQLLYGGS